MQSGNTYSRHVSQIPLVVHRLSTTFLMLVFTVQLIALSPTPVLAQPVPGDTDAAIPLGDYLKLSDNTKVSEVYDTPAFLVNLIVRNLFVVAGIILLVIGLYAGFQYITGGRKGMDNAKQMLTAAAVGFILMFSAYWIVQIIKIVTGTEILL